MFKEDKQNKIFGRRKGKNLSNLQKKNLNRYLKDFSIFSNDNDNIDKLKKINPYNLFHELKTKDIRLEIGFGMGDFLFDKALSCPKVGFIGCEIYVEKQTQKGILIGHKGEALKKVGIRSRKKLQAFFEKKINIEIFVKVLKNWRNNKKYLKKFGYNN